MADSPGNLDLLLRASALGATPDEVEDWDDARAFIRVAESKLANQAERLALGRRRAAATPIPARPAAPRVSFAERLAEQGFERVPTSELQFGPGGTSTIPIRKIPVPAVANRPVAVPTVPTPLRSSVDTPPAPLTPRIPVENLRDDTFGSASFVASDTFNPNFVDDFLIPWDVWLNEQTGGQTGETISARVGRRETLPAEILATGLDAIDPGHTARAVAGATRARITPAHARRLTVRCCR